MVKSMKTNMVSNSDKSIKQSLIKLRYKKMISSKANTPYKQLTKEKTMNGMYQRDSNKAFENAKLKGLNKPNEFMYMYSLENFDYFKNINFRNYIRFPINIKSDEDIVSTYNRNNA